MPRSQILSASYPCLFREIKTAFTQGLLSAQKALEYQRLKTYWTIGRCVEQAVKNSKGSLTYGQGLYIKISDDLKDELNLDISTDMLGRMVQFYKGYPRFPQKNNINIFTLYCVTACKRYCPTHAS